MELQNTIDETNANEWITQWKQTMRVQHKNNVLKTHFLLLKLGKLEKHMLKAPNCCSILKAPCNLHVFCMGYMH